MEPSLRDRDRLLVRYGRPPRVGDVVVVRLPDRPLAVKRVVRHGADGWWVERDSPYAGVDSWLVGAIPEEDVHAVVVRRIWPLRRRRRRRTAG